ncbi:Quinate/shikimate dehydrogenase (quinone) [Luteitalea pratensis]|uniref:Quinate/shikimate dehydrogenase (Quinone) n=1 Tax=Luteitalea pratensis TaxID=1855912 RepID=A0A143PV16_LUTPR|nr:pyrroloquinoline quinone-dependent dehydrogenase [Luteitalea pratensis]AMY11910.1 Quinate/shikimate dehydrogenase (quinone) [Luteitalea pratensis]
MRAILLHSFVAAASVAAVTVTVSSQAPPAAHESARYSPLADVTRSNVTALAPAWTFHTGDFSGGQGPQPKGSVPGVQTRPIVSHGSLYVTTPSSIVIAIDAETGKEQWRHDPHARKGKRCYDAHRGASIWPAVDHERATTRTIFSGTCDGRLIAVDAATGRPRHEFGTAGAIDLRAGVDAREGEDYSVTSAPAIFRDLVITGALVPEEVPRGPAGDIRAFDVRTGREVWRFHTVPRPGEYGHETWPRDGWQRRTGANVWSSMTVDHERGLVFLPIGSASYDFYGGDRKGRNLFANSLVALDAATGTRRWHQQLVHHDVWDYDPPSQPILADIPRNGSVVPVVIQLTKTGLVFVFERVTGLPVFGLEERAVPRSEVPGEETSPTQPFPIAPAPLVRTQPVTKGELNQVTAQSREECERLFARVTSGGLYTPPGLTLTLLFPGTMGGATWSGGAVDPASSLLIVNTNEVGAIGQMVSAPEGSPLPYVRGGGGSLGAYGRFWDSQQLPCQAPPWGRLNAIDLRTGKIAWQVPLGNVPVLEAQGITGTGSLNLGGPVVTAGGLVFIGGATDSRIRAFDLATGQEVWRADLPASGHAAPVVYRGAKSGRQYVAIAAGGGGKFSRTISDAVVAFALR